MGYFKINLIVSLGLFKKNEREMTLNVVECENILFKISDKVVSFCLEDKV